jgi:transposase
MFGVVMSCLIVMSQKELHRLEHIRQVRQGSLTVTRAAELLGLSRSQVHRLLQAYDLDGLDGLVSKKRGRPSNRRHSEDFRNLALDLVREHYVDFGPTLAAEKLVERHRISVSKETLRQWMMEAGIWVSRRERKKRVFQPRGRRDCFGELVQIDGSHHWWFEDRGRKCALLVYIDDATGKLLHLRFAASENTFDYLHATKVFRSTHASMTDRTSGLTQFGRALYELNIDIICANTPQAKGRVERANQTLQDRLVKELRLRGIDTIEAANAYAPEFMADFNTRFGKPPRNPKDMHRPLADHENLDDAMCRKEVRKLSHSLTLRYDKVMFILDPTERARALAGKKLIVCDYPDGRLEITDGEASLPYKTFDTLRSVHRSEVVENKRLDDMLSVVAELQAGREQQRSKRGPRRSGQTDHMFGIPDGSVSNGYQKRGTEPGRKTDFTKDPAVIARRRQALARLGPAE